MMAARATASALSKRQWKYSPMKRQPFISELACLEAISALTNAAGKASVFERAAIICISTLQWTITLAVLAPARF
jgi:hypothetical protein